MAPWPAPATATRNGCLAAHRLDTPAVASPCPSAPTGAGGLFKAKAACPGLCKANSSLPRTATGRYGSWPCLPGEQQSTSAKVDFFNPEGHLPLGVVPFFSERIRNGQTAHARCSQQFQGSFGRTHAEAEGGLRTAGAYFVRSLLCWRSHSHVWDYLLIWDSDVVLLLPDLLGGGTILHRSHP